MTARKKGFVMNTLRFFRFVLPALTCAGTVLGAQGPEKKPGPIVKDSELQRRERNPGRGFPWTKTPAASPDTKKSDANANGGDLDLGGMASGEIIIKAYGKFSREVVKTGTGKNIEEKEILVLNDRVEIEQLQIKLALRASKVTLTRDIKTGKMERVEAVGKVELWTADRAGKGELLVYETKFGPNDIVLKDNYVLEGNPATGEKACLWQGDDRIEAEKFINDRKMDTIRVLGRPAATVTLPVQDGAADKPAAPPAAAPAAGGGGMLPSFSAIGGGKIQISADGEINYEGSTGRVRITRNVCLTQSSAGQSLKLNADEVVISLLLPPPGQPSSGNSMFAGTLKSLESTGRVDMCAGGSAMLFDHGLLDMQANTFAMEMKNPAEAVKIYSLDGSVVIAPKRLDVNMLTRAFSAGGPCKRQLFEGEIPSNRPPVKKQD
jgi:lipopolysaccharide export system protein LptA